MPSSSSLPAPWLSILIPAYNVARYIGPCLESVLSQAGDGVEVIVTDDCSTDETAELIARIIGSEPATRVRLLQNERNSGVSATRNRMLEASSGDYLWFIDADDRLRPGAIEGLKNIVEHHEPDLVICDFADYHRNDDDSFANPEHKSAFVGHPRRLMTDRKALLMGLFESGQLHSWSKIARRSVWGDQIRFPVGRYFEDVATTPLLALGARSYYYEPTSWIDYRRAEGSILATMNGRKCIDMMLSMVEITDRLHRPEQGLPTSVLVRFNTFCVRQAILCIKSQLREGGVADLLATLPEFLRAMDELLTHDRWIRFMDFSVESLTLRIRLVKWRLRAQRALR